MDKKTLVHNVVHKILIGVICKFINLKVPHVGNVDVRKHRYI